jgi:8-oxo-dGTP diphosphatase
MLAEVEEDHCWARGLPRKRCSAAGLIRDHAGRMLLVKPRYRRGWLLPGGIVEAGESPLQTLYREVREEIGVEVVALNLLCVDYLPDDGTLGDALHFLFDCGQLNTSSMGQVRALDPEIEDVRWASPDEARELLVEAVSRRLDQAPGSLMHAGETQIEFHSSTSLQSIFSPPSHRQDPSR